MLARSASAGALAADDWRRVDDGIELGWLRASAASAVGDSRIAVVRIDPARRSLALVGRNVDPSEPSRTGRQWAAARGLAVVINAGMFATDHVTHLGLLETGGRVHARSVTDYQSVAAFHPREGSGATPFRIFDLDQPGVDIASIRQRYGSLVQNLRLIKRPGENRWSRQPRRWSEAALGEDDAGRVLFVFSRSPFSMHDLNRELLAAEIGLVALQHLEGGPEAQLYLRAGETELELFGSFETSFREDDGNGLAWPIPNVLGVVAGNGGQ